MLPTIASSGREKSWCFSKIAVVRDRRVAAAHTNVRLQSMSKKLKSLLAVFLIFGFLIFAAYTTLPNQFGNQLSSAQKLNLADIIDSPVTWQGQTITVSGFFNLELEGDAIYLTEKDRKENKFKKSVSLVLDSIGVFNETESLVDESLRVRNLIALRAMVGRPVMVEGTFETKSMGGLSSGTLYVEYIEAL